MTFIEFMKKLSKIVDTNNKAKKDISQNEIHFFCYIAY